MEELYPVPVTDKNFEEVWESVDWVRRNARRKRLICRFGGTCSNLCFLVLALIGGNGLICDLFPGSYRDFLMTMTWFTKFWEKVSFWLPAYSDDPALHIFLILATVFGLSWLVCFLFSLLIRLLYYPLRKKLPSGSAKERASQLLTRAREAYQTASGTKPSVAAGTILFFIAAFVILAAYIFYLNSQSTLDTSNVYASGTDYALVLLGLSALYALCNWLLTLTTRFLYRIKLPYSFVADVEQYYVFAGEKITAANPAELARKRKADAVQKRQQALEQEKISAVGRAAELLLEAAHGGDAPAMEHYARHCLIAHRPTQARYWLERCAATGEASSHARKMLRRMKLHLRVDARFLKS